MPIAHTDRPRGSAATSLALALIALFSPGCLMPQNDSLEVGGVVPAPLQDKPDTIGRASDAPSVTSLDRSNWGASDFLVPSEMVANRPTYARRNTRYQVSSRASGEFPTLAQAMTLPRGPSEREQIYDAVTWPFLIMPAAFLIPLGLVFEPWIADVHQSPSWAYERHAQGTTPGDRSGPTGDPLVDRIGLPRITPEPISTPEPSAPPTPTTTEPDPAPSGAPASEPTPAEPNPAEPAPGGDR